MDYEKFISEIPSDTKNIILKAMDIYNFMEKKEMICSVYETVGPAQKKPLSKMDKKCGALFLASLLIDGIIKKTMNDCGVEDDKVFQYLGINHKNIQPLTEEQYIKHFEEDFKLILGKLKNAQGYSHGSLPNSSFFAEIIISNLAYEHVCGSDIIDWLYKYTGWQKYQFAGEHNSFRMLDELLSQKLESVRKTKNVSKSNGLGFGSMFSSNEEDDLSNNVLERYGEFLTEKEYKTNPAIGREIEIRNLMLSLLTPEKSAILVGEAGVGKTAVVEGLAYLITNKQVPTLFNGARIIKMNTSAILSGCMYVGMFEQRVEAIIQELIKQPNVILFIDEIHNVIGAGSSSKKDMDLANILKPYLDRGQIKMIGATTNEEYEEHIMRDSAFKRRFERVDVLEPEDMVVSKILNGTLPKIEQITKVKFDFSPEDKDMIIDYIVTCTNKKHRVYNDNVNNPDLSLTILKKSFAFAALFNFDSVKIEHIAESIRSCARINESTRNRQADTLLATFNSNKEVLPNSSRVIKFPGNS